MKVYSADERSRTFTGLRPQAPQACVSTISPHPHKWAGMELNHHSQRRLVYSEVGSPVPSRPIYHKVGACGIEPLIHEGKRVTASLVSHNISTPKVPEARVELASLSAPDSKSGVFTVSPHGHSTGRSRTDKHLVLS